MNMKFNQCVIFCFSCVLSVANVNLYAQGVEVIVKNMNPALKDGGDPGYIEVGADSAPFSPVNGEKPLSNSMTLPPQQAAAGMATLDNNHLAVDLYFETYPTNLEWGKKEGCGIRFAFNWLTNKLEPVSFIPDPNASVEDCPQAGPISGQAYSSEYFKISQSNAAQPTYTVLICSKTVNGQSNDCESQSSE